MNTIKGIYHNGIIEPMIKPEINIPTEVLIIFPEEIKTVKKIGGLFKNYSINYSQIDADLKKLNNPTPQGQPPVADLQLPVADPGLNLCPQLLGQHSAVNNKS